MKQLLLIFTLFCASYITVNAQTKTWIGASGANFNVAANWSPSGIPNTVNDVIIPTGSNLIVDGANVKSITTQGTVAITMTAGIGISDASTLSSNTTFNWSLSGFGGTGTLTNNGTINVTGSTGKSLNNSFTLLNNGTINYDNTSNLTLGNGNPMLNNAASGILNFNTDISLDFGGGIGTVINAGLMRKAQGSGTLTFDVPFQNNSGTVSIESGTFRTTASGNSLIGGIYNVTIGNSFEWAGSTTLLGTLTGQLDGQINWIGSVGVATDTEAILDFSGSAGVNWTSGNLGSSSNGMLTNRGTLNLVGTTGKSLSSTVTLKNEGIINHNGSGALTLGGGSPIFNNTTLGTYNINNDSTINFGGGIGTLVNSGLIRKQQGIGTFNIDVPLQNNNGTITVNSGILKVTSGSTTLTDGIYNVTTGNSFEWAGTITLLGSLTGQLDGQIHWMGSVGVATDTEAILDFSGSTGVNWTSGNFGSNSNGMLTNRGTLNLVGTTGKSLSSTVTLKNEGTINHTGTGALALGGGSPILNNTILGTMNLNSDSAINFGGGIGTLTNSGLIRKQQGTGLFTIDVPLLNNDGTLSVESGTLRLNNASSVLTDGTYDVTADNTLEWANSVNLIGTLIGELNGQINWTGSIGVAAGTEVFLNFSGPTGVNWTSGGLGGDGTLTNMGILNIVSTTGKSISGTTNLNNEAIINYNGTGGLTLGFGSPTLTNATSGVVNLNADSAFTFQSGIGNVVNQGLFLKVQSMGTFNFSANTNNMSPGSIICENGLINFGTYVGNGLIGGNGSVQMPTNPIFDGTIAPGSSPGTLTYIGNYNSSPNAILDIEINGLNAGTQYDVFAIQGNGAMNGVVNITLGFAANLNDEFVVATTTGTISQCNLAPTASADFNGMTYTFDVFCRNDNQVVLKLVNITLGVNDFELSASNIQLYPNPVRNMLTIKNVNNLELDNAQIIDITGKVITTFDLQNMRMTKEISVENLSSGMYFVKINGLNSSITKRIIKL